MKQESKFAISEFRNPSGELVHRVSGWLDGKRIRRNFATRKEAETERHLLDIQAVQAETGVRVAATRLDEAQLHEAEAMFCRLDGQKHSLTFCVEFALANYREPERQKSLSEAVAEYVAAKEHELKQDYISKPQMERIRADLKKLVGHFPRKSVAELTPPQLVTFIELGRPSLKTYNNRRGILGTFFKFCFHRDWIEKNPILKVPQHRLRRRGGTANTLSLSEVRELMEHFETFEGGRWVPYFALCLFAGIRPGVPHGEIKKLDPSAVDLDAGVINITGDVSKVREPRQVMIQPNLAAWLRAYPLTKFPIVVGNFQKRRAKFRDRFHLTHDVLRHTFISMFVAKFRSIGEAAIQAGNSESIIRRHYLNLKSAKDAEAFFSILPKHAPENTGDVAASSAAAESSTPSHRKAA